jgi:hypothetical protein
MKAESRAASLTMIRLAPVSRIKERLSVSQMKQCGRDVRKGSGGGRTPSVCVLRPRASAGEGEVEARMEVEI